MAEWLGSGLQNHVRRFESAPDLNPLIASLLLSSGAFLFPIERKSEAFSVKRKQKRYEAVRPEAMRGVERPPQSGSA